MGNRISADVIINLLEKKHSKDVFIPQCKTGASWGKSVGILDAWAMKASWSKPFVCGYEIKVNRGDFIADTKWQTYMAYCNEFYFVCPKDVIKKEELPAEVGLYYVTTGGDKLIRKKVAPRRMDIVIPESIFRYILMWRTKVCRDTEAGSGREYWENWLKEKRVDSLFGNHVSKCIRKAVNEKIFKVQNENQELRAKNSDLVRVNKELADIKKLVEDLGFNLDFMGWGNMDRIKEKIEAINKGLPEGLMEYLVNTIRNMESFRETLSQALDGKVKEVKNNEISS